MGAPGNIVGSCPGAGSPPSPCSRLLIDRSKRPLHGLIWPQAGCASIAYAAMAPVNFLPLPAAPSFLAKQETSPTAILR